VAATNWAGNVTYTAKRLHRPTSLDKLRRIVARADRVRPLGTGHSFNRLADTPGDLVSTARMPSIMDIDVAGRQVRVGSGVRYGELATYLHRHGYALSNLASLPHISVGGAVATGTHGSGVANGSLAAAVTGLRMVAADGELVELSRQADGDRFAGAVVALGALGVVTELTLQIQPAFEVRQRVYENLPPQRLREDFDAIMSAGYSVSLFTGWTGPGIDQVWVKALGEPPGELFGALAATQPRHPIAGEPADACTQQLGVAGPWHERLPHFRLEFTPSSGDELQSEYFVPRGHAAAALAALDGIRDRIAPALLISEIRAIAADDLWLSPCHGRDSVAVHFTWKPDAAAVLPVLGLIEDRLAQWGARPHWGKLFRTPPAALAGLYPRLDDFAALARELDPAGKFRNDLLDRYLPR
jgi:xylitol oxidase